MMGMKRFAIALLEEPDLVAVVMDRLGALQWEAFERAVRFECVGGVWNADDIVYTTDLMVHPKCLRRHLFPWYQRIGDVCRARGCCTCTTRTGASMRPWRI